MDKTTTNNTKEDLRRRICDEEISNEEYREKLKNIFARIEDNKKLRFWYKYISGVEGRC